MGIKAAFREGKAEAGFGERIEQRVEERGGHLGNEDRSERSGPG